MFELTNLLTNLTVVYSYNNQEIEFDVESILNRRLREPIAADKVFIILNEYLNYKGHEFKIELYKRLLDSYNLITITAAKKNIDVLPHKIVDQVLELFDFEDVKAFVSKCKYVSIPSKLPEEYDEKISLDEKGSREQTYTKSDYIELVTLLTIIKSVVGVIGEFASMNSNILSGNQYKEYILFGFLSANPIFKTRPFQKIYDSLGKLIERLFNDDENTAIRIIERNLSRDIIQDYITALVVIQKLLLNNEVDDNDLRNTITKVYGYASNILKLKDSGSNIKLKRFSSGEDDSADNESILESYRTPSEISLGHIEEFKMVPRYPIRLARDIGVKADEATIYKMIQIFDKIKTPLPIQDSIYIIAPIFTRVTHPMAFEYYDIDELAIFLAIAFLYLWENDFKTIAMIISSYSIDTSEVRMSFSLRNKIDPAIKEELQEVFPNNRVVLSIHDRKETNVIEDTVTLLSKSLMSYDLVTIAPDEYVTEFNGVLKRDITVPEDIKNKLAKLFIHLNR